MLARDLSNAWARRREIAEERAARPLKKCPDCKEEKPRSEFQKDSKAFDGLYTYCKECVRTYMREYTQRTLQVVLNAKDQPCVDCGIKYPPHVMDFDHVRGTKRFDISGQGRSHSVKAVLEEISKCEVVCANCHRIRTQERLYGTA